MKSEEFLDEGIGDAWRSTAAWAGRNIAPLAKTGVLGRFAKTMAQTGIAGKEEAIAFAQNFARELENEFKAAIQSGVLTEFAIKTYSDFDLLLENIIEAAGGTTPIPVDQWLENIISDKVAQYQVNPNHKAELPTLITNFATGAAGKKFPMNAAIKIGDWLYRVAISQQRGYGGRVELSPGKTAGLSASSSTSTFGTAQIPTEQQWIDITKELDDAGVTPRGGGSWIGKPLAFRDNELQSFQFNFPDKKWYNTTAGAIGSGKEVEVSSTDFPKLNSMFVQKFNALLNSRPTPTP